MATFRRRARVHGHLFVTFLRPVRESGCILHPHMEIRRRRESEILACFDICVSRCDFRRRSRDLGDFAFLQRVTFDNRTVFLSFMRLLPTNWCSLRERTRNRPQPDMLSCPHCEQCRTPTSLSLLPLFSISTRSPMSPALFAMLAAYPWRRFWKFIHSALILAYTLLPWPRRRATTPRPLTTYTQRPRTHLRRSGAASVSILNSCCPPAFASSSHPHLRLQTCFRRVFTCGFIAGIIVVEVNLKTRRNVSINAKIRFAATLSVFFKFPHRKNTPPARRFTLRIPIYALSHISKTSAG